MTRAAVVSLPYCAIIVAIFSSDGAFIFTFLTAAIGPRKGREVQISVLKVSRRCLPYSSDSLSSLALFSRQ